MATVLLLYTAASSLAGSVTEPGETVGLPNGAPAPPGVFLAYEANYGCRGTNPLHTCVLVNIPLLAWSTPWTIFRGRLVFAASPTPASSVSILNTTSSAGLFNPFVPGLVSSDLGHDWEFQLHTWSLHQNRQSGDLQFKLAQSAFRVELHRQWLGPNSKRYLGRAIRLGH